MEIKVYRCGKKKYSGLLDGLEDPLIQLHSEEKVKESQNLSKYCENNSTKDTKVDKIIGWKEKLEYETKLKKERLK